MKIKVKITGWLEGKRQSFVQTIETPDFQEREIKFMGRIWVESIQRQQVDWLDDNYSEIIVPLAEQRWFWPIEGYEVIQPKVRINKRQQVIEIAEDLLGDWSIDMKEEFLVSLAIQWPQIKKQSINNIFMVVFNTMEVANAQTGIFAKRISAILKGEESVKKNNLKIS